MTELNEFVKALDGFSQGRASFLSAVDPKKMKIKLKSPSVIRLPEHMKHLPKGGFPVVASSRQEQEKSNRTA